MATSLSIGMFDGVHAGHRAIIDRAREVTGPGGRLVVVTFEPGPAAVLAPDRVPERLMTASQRTAALKEAGVDEVHVLETTPGLLQQPAQRFLMDLVDRYKPSHIVEGSDFRFGCDRAGDLALMEQIGAEAGFSVHVVADVQARLTDGTEVPARSSVIRRLLEQGRVKDAACVLGRPWQLEGEVVRGNRRGRELGCPTANLDTDALLTPAEGVYAGTAYLDDGSTYLAAVSVGTNPTFGDGRRSCEAHLLEFDGPVDSYGWRLKINVEHWLREQLKFDSIEALKSAMDRDLLRVQDLIKG